MKRINELELGNVINRKGKMRVTKITEDRVYVTPVNSFFNTTSIKMSNDLVEIIHD